MQHLETHAAYGLAVIGICLCLILASMLIASAFAVFGEKRRQRVTTKPNRYMQRRKALGLD
jgi:hypothetical protein